MRARAVALVLLLLGVPALLPSSLPVPGPARDAAAQATLAGVTYGWWDPQWHMRVPVVVEPRIVDRLSGGFVDLTQTRIGNYPATVELDFTQAIRDAGPAGFGWPKDAQGNLASFTMDTASVRVVEYDRFRGCPLIKDRVSGQPRCGSASDRLPDMLVPASFSPSLWENSAGRDPTFDAQRNAVGTVQWIVAGDFLTPRLYYVYFDAVENGVKSPAAYKPEDSALLDGLQHVRWGTDVIGFATGGPSGSAFVLAQALYDNTTVQISKYNNRGVAPQDLVRGLLNALDTAQVPTTACTVQSLGYMGTACLEIPAGEHFFFRVQASRPVIVGLRAPSASTASTAAWYPSRDAGIAGREFIFRALSSTGSQSPAYVLCPSGPASVTVQDLDSGFSTSASVDGATSIVFTQGDRLKVTANRPVLIAGSGGASPLLTYQGAPLGAHLTGPVWNDVTLMNSDTAPATLLLGSPISSPNAPSHVENKNIPPGAAASLRTPGCICGTPEAWRFDAAADTSQLWGWAGGTGLAPLAGRGGRSFQVDLRPPPGSTALDTKEARVILVGFYNNTRVSVVNATNGAVLLNASLGLHDWIDKSSTGQILIPPGAWRIEATKPVGAYFFAADKTGVPPVTMYEAKVEPPLATVGAGEFHGYAVGWADKVKTTAVGPGERVRLRLSLVNLGHDIGNAALSDDFTVTRETTKPANATAPNVDLSSVLETGVQSYQSRVVTLSVDVPADAVAGTVYQVNVTARSRGNPNFADTARIVVTVQIRYEFTLRFVETNGTSIQKIIKPGTATCMDVELRNTGTGDANVRLQMAPSRGPADHPNPAVLGFDPELLPQVVGPCVLGGAPPLLGPDGRATSAVAVPRGQARFLTLYVEAPNDNRPLPLDLEIQGVAAEDASVRQQLNAVVFTNVEAKVKLTALNDTLPIGPGGNATFRFLLENVGDVETPVEYGTTGLLPLGWSLAFVDAPPLLQGRGITDAAGKPLDKAEFSLNVTAASDAPVALLVPLNVVATSAILVDTGDTSKAFKQSDTAKATATVANNFTLEQPDSVPLTINPGEPFPLSFDLRNAANGNFTLRVLQGALPRNWSLGITEPAGPVLLERGDRVQVRVNVTPEVATRAGTYDLGLAFVTQDPYTQGAQFRNVTVVVRSTAEFRIVPDLGGLVLAPGAARDVGLTVTNVGNLPVQLRLTAPAPSGYQTSLPQGSRAELLPGASTRMTLHLVAPSQPAEQVQRVRLVATDETTNRQREFGLDVQTARVDLAITDFQLPNRNLRAGDTAVVLVTVENRGTLAANNVALTLTVDGRGVRNETLRTLPPGEPRTITIPWTVDAPPQSIVVTIDADDKYAETDESNNQAKISLTKPLPGFEAPVLALAVALAVAGTKSLRARNPRAEGRPTPSAARLKRGRRGGGLHG